ncbi:MAG: hypothetical protein ACFE0I_02325 [Elainellaceae cyanobacterium]
MRVFNPRSLVKALIGITGIASAGILLSAPAKAQSDVKLSPEGLEILCERFPLNSRCMGDASPEEGIPPRVEPSVLDESPSEPDYEVEESGAEMPEEPASEMTEEGIPPRVEPSVLDESPSEPDDAGVNN